ncbi:hypothetical protein HNQ96_002117 [Aminobacter lissarensis]|uniref:DUF2093 domain-containing protein n=2 Tax=Aminobacter carboxidus TaxID=376165 RepID=A0A8E2BCZ5_9HYPH|nr:hypothetical protein [Aminobacter lissarensis]
MISASDAAGDRHQEIERKPMMNRFEGPGSREARIRYLDGDFQVTSPGSFVRCAVTGESIPLDELKYWSVARQEPYRDAAVSLAREIDMNPDLRKRK